MSDHRGRRKDAITKKQFDLNDVTAAVYAIATAPLPENNGKTEYRRRTAQIQRIISNYANHRVAEEVSVAVERRNQSERMAHTDDLTGFGNRRALNKALPSAEADPKVAVVRFDINNFGLVNKSSYDEVGGDAVLKAISHCIESAAAIFGSQRLFRRGGDEFIVLAHVDDAESIRDVAEMLVDQLIACDAPIAGLNGTNYATDLLRILDIRLAGVVAETFEAGGAALVARKATRKATIDLTTARSTT